MTDLGVVFMAALPPERLRSVARAADEAGLAELWLWEVTAEGNYADLVWHEVEFRDGGSFTYVVRDSAGHYLGCAYLYPMGRRTKLAADRLEYDIDVSWWVTPEAFDRGYYTKLYHALRHWVTEDFPFTRPYYSNAEIPG